MAQYEVRVKSLTNASDKIRSLAVNLKRTQEQLDNVRARLPAGFTGTKQQVSSTIDSVRRLNSDTGKMAQTLQEIASIYKKAEQSAIGDIKITSTPGLKSTTPLRLKQNTEGAQGVLFLSNLVLPDWLQLAVLKYEQTRK